MGGGWYRGDFHTHTRRSHGGELTPEQLVTAARAAGLDVIAITEHGAADTHDVLRSIAGDELLVIVGREVVTPHGHWLALGVTPEGQDLPDDVAQVHEDGGLCVVAHPHAPYPSGLFAHPLDGFDAVEVWNGLWSSDLPWNADNEAALAEWGLGLAAEVRRGRWRPAIGNSDVHLADQIGTPQTVVQADDRSSQAVLAGIRAGRCWIAESAKVGLSFTAHTFGRRSAGIGERLEAGRDPVSLRLEVSGVPSGFVTFRTARGRVHGEALPSHGQATTVEWATSRRESGIVRIEVRHPDGRMAAITNPIILA